MNIWMDDYYKIRIYLQQISGQKISAPIRKIQCNRLIYITLLFTIQMPNIWMDDYYKIRIYLQQISGQKISAPIRKIQCNRLIYITLLFTIQMPNIPVNFLAAMMANTECAQNCHPMKEPYFLHNISHRKSGRAYQSGHADDVHQPESTYLCS